MLRKTFIHLSGIGEVREEALWKGGVASWTDLESAKQELFRGDRKNLLARELSQTFSAYEKGDLHFFYERLPRRDLWRLIPGHESRVAFVDIETTGLFPPNDKVTTLSVLMNGKLYQAHGRPKIRRLIERVEEEADILVTYYGEVFDVPFLRAAFRVPLKKAHLDLCFMLRRLGHTGGLKAIQNRFRGLPKRKAEDIDGFGAVLLWRMFERGDRKALETLLVYNGEDTVVLQHLLERAIRKQIAGNPHFRGHANCAFKRVPPVPGRVSKQVLRKVQRELMSEYVYDFEW